jgi:hypothetical protein
VKGKLILKSVLTHTPVNAPALGGLGHLKSLTIAANRLDCNETRDGYVRKCMMILQAPCL